MIYKNNYKPVLLWDNIFEENTLNDYTISSALALIRNGLMAFALIEYYGIKPTNIIGIVHDITPIIYFDQEGFSKASLKELKDNLLIKNSDDQSIIVINPRFTLHLLSSQKILKKFPFFQKITDKFNYKNVNLEIEIKIYLTVVKTCRKCGSNGVMLDYHI